MTGNVEVKVSELSREALNWAVAKAVGEQVTVMPGMEWKSQYVWTAGSFKRYSPSTDWSQGGPLIEKYRVSLIYAFEEYEALIGMTHSQSSESPLVAACHAIVASVLGDTVSVPKELV